MVNPNDRRDKGMLRSNRHTTYIATKESKMTEQVKEHDEIQAIELSDEQLERLGLNVGQHMGASDTTSKHPSGTCRQQC